MKVYSEVSLKEYINDLAAKLAVPGGGSASALCAAMGISLLSMVINFTLGKPKYRKYEKKLKSILKKSEELRDKFLRFVDRDIQAYGSGDIKEALKVSLEMCNLSFQAIKLCPLLINTSNINLISDVAVSVILLEAAFSSASFNVKINLKLLNNKKMRETVERKLIQKKRVAKIIRKKTEDKIGKIIGR